MLKLLENCSSDTARWLRTQLPQGFSTAYVLFPLLDEFSIIGAWTQSVQNEITALVVQTAGGRVRVTASETADFEELHLFLRQLGGIVECAPEISVKLGITPRARHSLLVLDALPEKTSTAVPVYDDFRPIYALLLEGSEGAQPKNRDQAFAHWLSATARGVFGGRTQVMAVYEKTGALFSVAIADIFENYVYLRDVVTKKTCRGSGYGSDCVRGVCQKLKTAENDIFLLCANAQTEKFYQKLGFTKKTEMELGSVE